jgi:phage terminase large subunit-like protein
VISIPAIAEADDPLGRAPGELLWDEPEGYNYAAFLKARQRETSPMMWSALYQQRPAPEEGDYFKADWLKTYEIAPARETLRIYGASDYAVTADGGDFTVHIVVGLDPEGRMYVLDLWRKQASSDVWIDAFCDLVWRKPFPTRGDKAVRAQSIRGRMALEGLYLPSGASWVTTLRSELLSFPAGKHDDQVDALGLIGQLLDIIQPGQHPPKPEVKAPDSGYRPAGELADKPLDWMLF